MFSRIVPALAHSRGTEARYAVNLTVFAVTLPFLLPFALLHELTHVAGFLLMRCAGFRVEGIRLDLSVPARTAPLLYFAPVAVTVDAIRLGTRPRWYHRACALLAALGPLLFTVAGVLVLHHVAVPDDTPLFYTLVLFTAVMAPSLDDLRAAHWSLTSPSLEA